MLWISVFGALVLGAVVWGPVASQVEQPEYKIVERDGAIELRDYPPMIVAETRVSGERNEAIGKGFRIIADYIFGNNVGARKVAMTAPVTQQSGETIAMTAPVTAENADGSWRVRFIMPAGSTLQTLPVPKNPAVVLKPVPAARFAVIRFSGLAGADSLRDHTAQLMAFIEARDMKVAAAPTYAFYNPPWTLPFLRRNEIMIEVADTIDGRE